MDLIPLTESSLSALAAHVSESLSRSKKCCAVVVDPRLGSLVNPDAGPASSIFLRAGATREYILSNEGIDWKDDGPVIYILRPNPRSCKSVALQIKAMLLTRPRPEFKAVFVPRRSFRCEELLREEEVLKYFTQGIHAVSLSFASMDDDLISMELDEFIRETKIDGDTSSYSFVARALLDFGPIKNIRTKGHRAKEVFDLYSRMQREMNDAAVTHISKKTNQQQQHEDEEEDVASAVSGEDFGMNNELNSMFSMDDSSKNEEDEDENVRATTKVGGPMDILGAFPRPARKRRELIDTLILIDREVDMVSPLCTPLTYESLLDESFGGLKSGFLTIKSSVLRLDDLADEDVTTVSLSAGSDSGAVLLSFKEDQLFHEIRDTSVTSVMRILNEKAKELKETQEKLQRSTDVQYLRDFVKTLPEVQQLKKRLATHIALAQRVSAVTSDRRFRQTWHAERAAVNGDGKPLLEKAQDCAARGDSLYKVLRLLCLSCILSGGFSSGKLDEIRQDLLHAYGFEHIFSLDNLERLGMLAQRPFHPQHRLSALQPGTDPTSSSSCIIRDWASVRDTLDLLANEEDDMRPKSCGYVLGGFIPLSVRLVQMDMEPGGWAARKDVLRILGGGPMYCDAKPTASGGGASKQQQRWATPMNTAASSTPPPTSTLSSTHSSNQKKVLLVFFLGGVTYAEIGALRFLAKQPGCPFRIVIATTAVVNGNSLIKACCHPGPLDPTSIASPMSSSAAGDNPFA